MALEEYRRKRRFDRSPEPRPEVPEPGGQVFCVQRHFARSAHYDLRLEHNGVLLSWAVPQGPTLDTSIKRLAVHVEDHPVAYGEFEGNIPKGEYGAGSVMLWDFGKWVPLGDVSTSQQLQRGDLKFFLYGRKLRGEFTLVRMKPRGGQEEWLLLKKPDSYAMEGWETEDYAWSVSTGRLQHEIEADAVAQFPPLPRFSGVMLAERSTALPRGGRWLYEIKWDGVRAHAYLDRGLLHLISRSGADITSDYPEVSSLPALFRAPQAIIDGEIAVCDAQGRPRFSLIQPRIQGTKGGPPAVFFAFDLLWLNGRDLRDERLEQRRRLLADHLRGGPSVRLSESFENGEQLLAASRQMELEGIVAKRMGSRYLPRRSQDWLKIKVAREDDFFIAGYTVEKREPISALVLCDETRRYVGNVGTGFTMTMLRDLFAKLQPLRAGATPIPDTPGRVTWVRPELRCRVSYHEWTSEGRLRAPVYGGLSEPVRIEPPRPVALAPAVKVSNPTKVLFPAEGITKRDLVTYYEAVAEWMVPHLARRPLTLLRYPDGIEAEGFFQKDVKDKLPSWFPVIEAEDTDGITKLLASCDSREALLHLANLACIDFHPWMSRAPALDFPDFLLIDLDPFQAPFSLVADAALRVKSLLDAIGLVGYPKTTGGNGMHIYVPLQPVYPFEMVRKFGEAVCRLLAAESPKVFTLPRSLSRRTPGRVYYDWMQVGRGKAISAPYSVRPRPGAPVATPLDWTEVRPNLSPSAFHLRNAVDRFRGAGDLFMNVLRTTNRLEEPVQALEQILQKIAARP